MADERLTLRQAATRLGVSESAIRKRVERGTLRSDKGSDGRRYIYLASAELGADRGADMSDTHESGTLISELRDRLRYVEGQLEAERQAHAEARRIIAGLVERIPPQLEAPSEAQESPETAESPGPRERPFTDEERAQEASQPRPWWRRMFG
jgi:hypothetical protein